MAHKHAKLMMQYAIDAMEHDEPWLLWEFNEDEFLKEKKGWQPLINKSPCWWAITKYRRKKDEKTTIED
jgi:hypothetical protein